MIKHLADHIQAETAQILRGARLARQAPPVVVEGELTDMVCSCGGKLRAIKYVVTDMLPPCPTHRKKRIRKKLAKRWAKETLHLRVLTGMIGAMQPPKFKCVECGRVDSIYSAMGRNLITVEPLPEGAMDGIHFDAPPES